MVKNKLNNMRNTARQKCNLEFRKLFSLAHTVLLTATVDSLVQTKCIWSWISVAGIVTGWRTGARKNGVSITGRRQKCIFSSSFSVNMRHTQPPIYQVKGALPWGLNWPGCEAGHSPLSSAEVFEVCSYVSTNPYTLLASTRTALQC